MGTEREKEGKEEGKEEVSPFHLPHIFPQSTLEKIENTLDVWLQGPALLAFLFLASSVTKRLAPGVPDEAKGGGEAQTMLSLWFLESF